MIQRIQTVYLVLAFLAFSAVGTILTPGILAGATEKGALWFKTVGIGGLSSLCGVVFLFSISLYSVRKRQLKIVRYGQYAVTALFALTGFVFGSEDVIRQGLNDGDWRMFTGAGLILLGYLFSMLARRGILADIKLIESVDRLR